MNVSAMESSLVKENPLLLPLNNEKTVYDGFITVQRLQQSADLVSFILELKTVLEVCLKSSPDCRSIPPPQYYSQLISEMETLGWGK
ncbi:E3 ubiquitin-protein ligase FANCL [Nibea albiflora]|uniref:E3 ubiquitin-protein ligase FANCL n=1 Tax=Nibea albiflora TaxID=240163 RepID=A0ACB7EDF3_NIBAL|nr:E3 ubiquitin-protein ligase FANCL [Nibea albiflora]